MARSTQPGPKRLGKGALIGSLAAAVATILGALTPFYIAVSDAQDRSEDKAEKADDKADLGYKLLRLRVEFLEKRLNDSEEDVTALRKFLRDVIVERAHGAPHGHSEPRMRPAMRRPASMGGGGLGGLGDASAVLGNGEEPLAPEEILEVLEAEMVAEAEEEPPPMEQMQLPENLEAELLKMEEEVQADSP